MPALQIRDLPDDLYDRIKRLSEREHRSLSSQALVLLEEALSRTEEPRERRLELVEAIERRHEAWSDELPAPEELIAEDRAR